MGLLELLLMNFPLFIGIGWILGFIWEWNEKVLYIIFATLIISLLAGYLIFGAEELVSSSPEWYISLYNMIMCFIGIQLGKFSYKRIK